MGVITYNTIQVRILSGPQKIFLNVEKKVHKKFYNPNKIDYFYIIK